MIEFAPDATRIREALSELPDEARLWIYGADRDLSDEEVAAVRDSLSDFLQEWSSHGRDVYGQAEVIDNRFLLIGAHIPSGDISGCGIDKSTRVVEELAGRLGFDWLSPINIFFRDGDRVRSATRSEFRTLAREGSVDASTPVYDLTIPDVAALRTGRFLQPVSRSWHGRAFGIAGA